MKQAGAIRRLWGIIGIFLVIITGVFIVCMSKQIKQRSDQDTTFAAETIIDLNEIERLTAQDNDVSPAEQQIDALVAKIRDNSQQKITEDEKFFVIMYVISILVILSLGIYLHNTILRPFRKMERFADDIAKGNFETELRYERQQFFGSFTWAFDSMRREIIKARSCEKEAVENNKMVIATLSHDIKTPIASIRAYSEAMESNMDTSIERRARYLKVIIKKCDEVTELTNDLFVHSISDLNKLVINTELLAIGPFLKKTVTELTQDKDNIQLYVDDLEQMVEIDQKRLTQVIENLIGNARKYASGSRIRIWTEVEQIQNQTQHQIQHQIQNKTKEQMNQQNQNLECKQIYAVHIRDYGPGIAEEDMPFIFEKFYRGHNVSNYPGAGLGLYIVKYVMEQMNGEVALKNHKEGLEVTLRLPVVSIIS